MTMKSNSLHHHRPRAHLGSAGAGPEHACDAAARAAGEDDRRGRARDRSVADRDQCPRSDPAGRKVDAHQRGAEFHRLRGPAGAGGGAFAHGPPAGGVVARATTSDESFAKDPPNATISVFSKDGSKIRDAVVTLKRAKLDGDKLTFDVDVLEGELTGGDGAAALFIDRVGFGGFHAGGFHAGGYGRLSRRRLHAAVYARG